jgi:hypothetical protein
MKKLRLEPDQIIALNDFPLYNKEIFMDYLVKCKQKNPIPLVPIIKKEHVKKLFRNELLKIFKDFEQENPKSLFFLLDGSHRTTAWAITSDKIQAILLDGDKDIKKARELVAKGQVLRNAIFDHSFEENCRILFRHFSQKPYFITVEQKTKKLKTQKKLSS